MNTLALHQQSPIQLLELVRSLPDRRAVYRAEWQQQAVFVKVFYGAQALRYAQRDAQGARWMLAAGLQTPDLLWQGQAADLSAQVLIYAAVANALNADAVYKTSASAERLELLLLLSAALAQQHAAGLEQTDLHLKNFVLAQGQVWAIDGDGIRQHPLSTKQALKQLAALISKLNVLDQEAWTARLVAHYLQVRGMQTPITPQPLLRWAKAMKAQEVQAYVTHKIFRTCSAVQWQVTPAWAQAISTAGGLQAVTPTLLETAMQQGRMLKPGNTCTVVQAALQQQTVVIKRYNIKHRLHALLRCWRASRAAASWANAHRLAYYGIVTPAPLLMLETRWFGLRKEAYFVAEYSPWPDAKAFFQATTDKRLRAEAVRQLCSVCYQFYLLQLSHGDMKASNLQISSQGQVVVMDLDSMRQHRCAKTALRAHVKDLRRLMQNWKDDTSLYNALVKGFYVVYADATPLKLAGISI